MSGDPQSGFIESSTNYPTHQGDQSLRIEAGNATNQTIYQDFSVSTGFQYEATGFLYSPSSNPLVGTGGYGAIQMHWLNATGSVLGTVSSESFTDQYPNDIWHALSVTGVPPVEAVSGRLEAGVYTGGSTNFSGTLLLDDLEVTAVPLTNDPPEIYVRPMILEDPFNDGAQSNIWSLLGYYTPLPTYQETNEHFVVSRDGDWATAGYITTQPLQWEENNEWYAFSSIISSMDVTTAPIRR